MNWKSTARSAASVAALGAALLAAPALAAPGGPAPSAPQAGAPGTNVTQVVVVPGQTFGSMPYQPLKFALESSGYQVQVLDTEGIDLPADAQQIAGAVSRARAADPDGDVALVGHSVGGLSSRYYLKQLGGADQVARYVAIGTPQYGNPAACEQTGSARDVCPGSDFLGALNGSGVDTPGPTKYYSIRSSKEWVDGRLTGAQCRMTPVPSVTGSGMYDHIIEPMDPRVLGQITAALSGQCDGRWTSEAPGSIKVAQTLYPGGKQASGA